jgi:C4-dicarboxylate-specific signal transduction histidine kinase
MLFSADWDAKQLTIHVRDHGIGLAKDIVPQLGKADISTKTHGMGLGLFLTQNTIERFDSTFYAYQAFGARCPAPSGEVITQSVGELPPTPS